MIRALGVVLYFFLSASFCMDGCAAASQVPFPLPKIPQVAPLEPKTSSVSKIRPPLFVHNLLVIIDPGHGGHDMGTESLTKPVYKEKSFNLVTALFIKDYLHQLGYQVHLTRETDKFVSLERRVQVANEKAPTLFVSVHYNSAPSITAQGIEVYYYSSSSDKERAGQSKRLAQTVLHNVIGVTKAKSRGVKNGDFLVIRETKMPAILVEGGFVSNDEELQKLKDPSYLKKIAWGIVKGIEEFLSQKKS